MPFVQMENISLFLEACKRPPFNLQSHDIFLTVDLYESKNPAQVLVCLGAFSRAMHKIDPVRFPNHISTRSRISPETTGSPSCRIYRKRRPDASVTDELFSINNRSTRPILTQSKTGDASVSARFCATVSGVSISSDLSNSAKTSKEDSSTPPWNIAQYGYLGGASQGNLGVSFGARRQITSAGPYIPSAAKKEKKPNEKELEIEIEKKIEIENLQRKAHEAERRRQQKEAAENERARIIEEKQWREEETRIRERELRRVEEESRIWEQEELRWQLQEENQIEEDRKFINRIIAGREPINSTGSISPPDSYPGKNMKGTLINFCSSNPESNRVRELERELELARKREREYERARQQNFSPETGQSVMNSDLASRADEENQALSLTHQPYTCPDNYFNKILQVEDPVLHNKRLHAKSTPDLLSCSFKPPTEMPIPHMKSPRPLPEPAQLSSLSRQKTGSTPLSELAQSSPLANQQTGSRHLSELAQSSPIAKQKTGFRPLSEQTLSSLLPKQQTRSGPLSELARSSPLPKQKTGSRPLPEPSQLLLLPKQQTGSRPLPEPTQSSLLQKQRTGSGPLSELARSSPLPKQKTGSRPLPEPTQTVSLPKQQTVSRPLPDPRKYAAKFNKSPNKTEHNIATQRPSWQSSAFSDSASKVKPYSSSSQRSDDSQCQLKELKTHVKLGGLVVKSLMEREMEMERQRQREWEENQKELQEKASKSNVQTDDKQIVGRLDLGQWSRFTDSHSPNNEIQVTGTSKKNVLSSKPLRTGH